MARIARVVAPGLPHHVAQRGNRGQETFFCEKDYEEYIRLISEGCSRWNVRVWAYGLMPNHVHMVVVPQSEEGLRRAIGGGGKLTGVTPVGSTFVKDGTGSDLVKVKPCLKGSRKSLKRHWLVSCNGRSQDEKGAYAEISMVSPRYPWGDISRELLVSSLRWSKSVSPFSGCHAL